MVKMKNFVQPGKVVTLTAPSGGVVSGQFVVIGAIAGVCAFDALQGKPVEVVTRGVFTLPKAAASALTEGQRVWWDVSPGCIVNASGEGHFMVGTAAKAAGENDATCVVRLDGVATVAVPGS